MSRPSEGAMQLHKALQERATSIGIVELGAVLLDTEVQSQINELSDASMLIKVTDQHNPALVILWLQSVSVIGVQRDGRSAPIRALGVG